VEAEYMSLGRDDTSLMSEEKALPESHLDTHTGITMPNSELVIHTPSQREQEQQGELFS
jgi:hypothetical protein